MDKDPREQRNNEIADSEEGLMDRRAFLLGLGKWSKIVVGSVLAGTTLLGSGTGAEAAGWANRGGGGAWANRGGGGGGAWANRGGGGAWGNHGGGGAWANRGGAWINGGAAWLNRGGTWANRY